MKAQALFYFANLKQIIFIFLKDATKHIIISHMQNPTADSPGKDCAYIFTLNLLCVELNVAAFVIFA